MIPREKMVPLLTELFKLEAYVVDNYGNITEYHKVMVNTGDSLLKAKGYTKVQFEESYDYYCSRQDVMLEMYSEILEDFTEEKGKLQGDNKTVVKD